MTCVANNYNFNKPLCGQGMELNDIFFLLLVAVGASVQTITGFAMGLIIMGGVVAFGLADIAFAAAVVSFVSLVNICIALRRTYRSIDKTFVISMAIGLVPSVLVGVLLLDYFSAAAYSTLERVLGLVIIAAGTLLMLKPSPFANRSPAWVSALIGTLGGVTGGLYGAGGAPLAYYMYRQPIDLIVIRASLLATFAISTTFRSIVISLNGHVTGSVLLLVMFAVPIVVTVTLVAGKYAHLLPDVLIRRLVYLLLILLGGSLVVGLK